MQASFALSLRNFVSHFRCRIVLITTTLNLRHISISYSLNIHSSAGLSSEHPPDFPLPPCCHHFLPLASTRLLIYAVTYGRPPARLRRLPARLRRLRRVGDSCGTPAALVAQKKKQFSHGTDAAALTARRRWRRRTAAVVARAGLKFKARWMDGWMDGWTICCTAPGGWTGWGRERERGQ